MTAPKIDRFVHAYGFLSNFHPADVVGLDLLHYPTVEHAFQAAKTHDPTEREWVRRASSGAEAKKRGRKVTLREDWENVKLQIMLELLRQKFQDPVLARSLALTGDRELEEGNWWGDDFWGTVRGHGENWLGILLMHVRKEVVENRVIPTMFLRTRERP